MHMDQDREQWWAVVNIVRDSGSQEAINFLTEGLLVSQLGLCSTESVGWSVSQSVI
jgi:hypothetical protein